MYISKLILRKVIASKLYVKKPHIIVRFFTYNLIFYWDNWSSCSFILVACNASASAK